MTVLVGLAVQLAVILAAQFAVIAAANLNPWVVGGTGGVAFLSTLGVLLFFATKTYREGRDATKDDRSEIKQLRVDLNDANTRADARYEQLDRYHSERYAQCQREQQETRAELQETITKLNVLLGAAYQFGMSIPPSVLPQGPDHD